MDAQELTNLFGLPLKDPEEETFILFSETTSTGNLGFIDPRAASIELTIAGHDYTIAQSPGILSSTRAGGTTGAVVWRITPALAAWLASAQSPLRGLLDPDAGGSRGLDSTLRGSSNGERGTFVLELGCGIAGILALALGPHVERYVLTDQDYVLKLLHANITSNAPQGAWDTASGGGGGDGSKTEATTAEARRRPHAKTGAVRQRGVQRRDRPAAQARAGYIAFEALDWEAGAASARLTGREGVKGFDVVLACDCVYNEALVEPFVATCVDVCRLRETGDGKPTVCLVAQQLRDPTVFEAWIAEFHQHFETWRVPDEVVPSELRPSSGLVVHLGILRT
ncbi:hypothetical protein BROUX41_001290 [Berkeleyomyces rouxiae]